MHIAFIVIGILLVLIITLLIILKIRKNKYIKFVIDYSVSFKKLIEINEKYRFSIPNDYDETYTYDNENFFYDISCEDYLIYQLQYTKNNVLKDIENIEKNKKYYDKYNNEVEENISLGNYNASIEKLNSNYLLKIEKECIINNLLTPMTNYYINIQLKYAKMNGRVYAVKEERFSANEIKGLIKRINNKNGTFYLDRGIWDSICRVERGKVSNKMRFSIYDRDGYRCCNCGRSGKFYDLEIDHIKPIAKGGKSTYDNLQTLCTRCNKKKGDKY